MLCVKCRELLEGEPPAYLGSTILEVWTHDLIKERVGCFICMRVWQYILKNRQQFATTESAQYNITRHLRVSDTYLQKTDIWARYRVSIKGADMPIESEIEFSAIPLNSKSYQLPINFYA